MSNPHSREEEAPPTKISSARPWTMLSLAGVVVATACAAVAGLAASSSTQAAPHQVGNAGQQTPAGTLTTELAKPGAATSAAKPGTTVTTTRQPDGSIVTVQTKLNGDGTVTTVTTRTDPNGQVSTSTQTAPADPAGPGPGSPVPPTHTRPPTQPPPTTTGGPTYTAPPTSPTVTAPTLPTSSTAPGGTTTTSSSTN